MEIEYSIFIFTNLFLFLNLLNSCFVARRFHRVETRLKLLEDLQQSSQPEQQAVVASYPPITTASYPQMTYAQPSYYQQTFSTYQAPTAPPPSYVQPYQPSAPSL